MLDEATNKLPQRRSLRPRVAGLIPTPPDSCIDVVREALEDRRRRIEAAAFRLVVDAEGSHASWLTLLGSPNVGSSARNAWLTEAATVALYRFRYDINDQTLLGVVANVESAEQAAERRAAQLAITRAQALSRSSTPGLLRQYERLSGASRSPLR